VCCSVLQCVAMCCNVLQCVAVCCSVLQRVDGSRRLSDSLTPPVLQRVAVCVAVCVVVCIVVCVTLWGVVCCRVLQCVAV